MRLFALLLAGGYLLQPDQSDCPPGEYEIQRRPHSSITRIICDKGQERHCCFLSISLAIVEELLIVTNIWLGIARIRCNHHRYQGNNTSYCVLGSDTSPRWQGA